MRKRSKKSYQKKGEVAAEAKTAKATQTVEALQEQQIEPPKKRARRAQDRKASEQQDGSDCLPIGSQHRMLPRHLDNLALSYLDLCDLAALFLCSKKQKAQVIRTLTSLKTLKILLREGVPVPGIDSEDGPLAPGLAWRYCKSLVHIVDADVPDAQTNSKRQQGTLGEFGLAFDLYRSWLIGIIRKNQHTIRSIPPLNATADRAGEVLVLCSNLEFLQLTASGPARLERFVVNRLKPAYLPNLHTLILHGDAAYKGVVTDRDLTTILKSGQLVVFVLHLRWCASFCAVRISSDRPDAALLRQGHPRAVAARVRRPQQAGVCVRLRVVHLCARSTHVMCVHSEPQFWWTSRNDQRTRRANHRGHQQNDQPDHVAFAPRV